MHGWDVDKTVSFHVTRGLQLFSLKPCKSFSPDLQVSYSELSEWEILAGLSVYLTFVVYRIMSIFRSITFNYVGLTLHLAVKSFVNFAKNENLENYTKSSWSFKNELLQKYGKLKLLSEKNNEAWAIYVFFVLMDHILWLATDLNLGMREPTFAGRLVHFWYFADVFCLTWFAAEAKRKVAEFDS